MSSSQHDHSHHSTSEHTAPANRDHRSVHAYEQKVTSHKAPVELQARFSATTTQPQAGRGQYNTKTDLLKEKISVPHRRPGYGGRGQYDIVPDKPRDPPLKRRTQPLLAPQEHSPAGRGQQNATPEGYHG